MEQLVYAILSDNKWRIATKVKALAYGTQFQIAKLDLLPDDLVWSDLATTGLVCKVGSESLAVPLSDSTDHSVVIVNREAFRVPVEVSDLIDGFVQVQEDKKRLTREIDVAMHGEKNAAPQAALCDLVSLANSLRMKYEEACSRLFDMLQGDDGQAWSEAERFLKAHEPELYDRIGEQKT